MNEIIFETDFAKIVYYPNDKLLELIWKRIITSSEYKEGFKIILNTIQERDIAFLLTDTSKQGVISPEDRQWLETEMIPPAIKAGLKYSATVLDKNIFKQIYMSKIVDASKKTGMEAFKLFDDIEKAREWLLSQKI